MHELTAASLYDRGTHEFVFVTGVSRDVRKSHVLKLRRGYEALLCGCVCFSWVFLAAEWNVMVCSHPLRPPSSSTACRRMATSCWPYLRMASTGDMRGGLWWGVFQPLGCACAGLWAACVCVVAIVCRCVVFWVGTCTAKFLCLSATFVCATAKLKKFHLFHFGGWEMFML